MGVVVRIGCMSLAILLHSRVPRLLSGLPGPIAADGGGDLFRTRMTDREQSVESGLGQVRLRSSNAPDQDNALDVGYRKDRIDVFQDRFLAYITAANCA